MNDEQASKEAQSQNKIRVLMVNDKLNVRGSSVHGVARLFSWWLPRFDRNQFDISLISLRGSDKGADFVREKGVKVRLLGRSKFDPRTISDLVRICREEHIELMHLHGYGAANFGRIAAKIAGCPVILHEHVVDPYIPGYQKLLDRVMCRLNDYAIAVSADVLDFMIDERAVDKHRIEIVHNGAPLSEFRPVDPSTTNELKRTYSIDQDQLVVGTVCRLDEQKGVTYFLDAAAEVHKQMPDVRFVVVGDGPLMDELKAQTVRQGTAESVIFTGYTANVRELQSLFDIYAISSLWEGGPLTVFEAMAMALPIVATPVGRLKEVIDEGVTGNIVPIRDGTAMANALLGLLKEPELARKMGKSGEQRSRQYDIQFAVDKMQGIYKQILGVSESEQNS